jgi:hypothetical protein
MLSGIVSFSNIAVAMIALGALYFTRVQLRVLGNQIDQASKASIAQTYGQIAEITADMDRMFLEHPEWYPYFYEGKEVDRDPQGQTLRIQLEHAAETFMDFVDMLLELRNVSPFSTMDWSLWEQYFRSVYNSSPALRSFISESLISNSLPDYELAALGLIVVRDTVSGQIAETWHAREFDQSDGSHQAVAELLWGDEWRSCLAPVGYPWVRTWVMRRIGDEEPSVIAPVSMLSPQEARVSVHWLWDRADGGTEETLKSWILGVLAGSKLISQAIVRTHLMSKSQGEDTYLIRDPKGSRVLHDNRYMVVQEPFLVPRYNTVHRRSGTEIVGGRALTQRRIRSRPHAAAND